MFAPHQVRAVLISDLGVFIWLAGIAYSIKVYGFLQVFRVYLMPYLWVRIVILQVVDWLSNFSVHI